MGMSMSETDSTQVLLSLPPAMARQFHNLTGRLPPHWVAACDPPGGGLGSGGGTANLLAHAWRQTGAGASFGRWLRASPKLLIHAGGASRRLPAYAHCGKALMPVPVFRWARGQRLDQTLLDLQLPLYRKILAEAPRSAVAMVCSGDVLLRSAGGLPKLPEVDVLCFGQWAAPEVASRHGAFFCRREAADALSFFLQKPAPDRIRQLAADHLLMIDTGVWLLSEAAVRLLMERSGWCWQEERFAGELPERYELYADFGLSLGASPSVPDAEIGRLTAAVVPLPAGEFYHFGASRDLVRSCSRLQNLVVDQRELAATMPKPHPDMYVQNAPLGLSLRPENHTLWVENSTLSAGWKLACEHILTGIPDNRWAIQLPRGVCVDMVPIGKSAYGLRVYGIDDSFRGSLEAASTTWCGRPACEWFAERGFDLETAGITPQDDIQDAALFPIVEGAELDEAFLQWLIDARVTGPQPTLAHRWLTGVRRSASWLSAEANLGRLLDQRDRYRRAALLALARNSARSVFYSLDLEQTAADYSESEHPLPEAQPADAPLMRRVHQQMFAAAVRRRRNDPGWKADEQAAFGLLRDAMIDGVQRLPVRPERRVLDGQIVWGRAPARLDLAGGWTDTPPYCLMHGGKVVNVAVDLNGQPPVQTFVRLSDRPHVVLRSIDLGVEEQITSYAELRSHATVGSGFSIAKAALALAGFLPEFHAQPHFASLEQQLDALGGGIEISLLAAIPKGSGLGTSSILAATLLGTLSDVCGHHWDATEICRRTLVLEQMLTTGGGWQDQIGGIVRGVKLTETAAGLVQQPVIRWLPDHLLTDVVPKSCMLLYYTGITRVAKGILKEIVRGMFLNAQRHTTILAELAEHAVTTADALVRDDWDSLCRCIRRSWDLNQRLDAGTNPAEIESLLDRVGDLLAAAKLLGAGGGGYLLMLAKDQQAAARIRQMLLETPPKKTARFVDFAVSQTGLEITRS
jgi:galactokinase/mevalonate kinase-like predicted kinase